MHGSLIWASRAVGLFVQHLQEFANLCEHISQINLVDCVLDSIYWKLTSFEVYYRSSVYHALLFV
jgi:hypothetical protein